MKKTVCEEKKCSGCKACICRCPQSCIDIKEEGSYLNALIDQKKCIKCNMCHSVCPVNYPRGLKHPIDWKQGWSTDESIRSKASSGGIASAVASSFFRDGGIVYACMLKGGEFRFGRVETEKDFAHMQGSKYVKSDPRDVYTKIAGDLRRRCKVLFIGLPCQVQAAKNFVGEKWAENFFTIDLVCHGSPVSKVLLEYLNKRGVNINNIKEFRFRDKTKFGLRASNYKFSHGKGMDAYMRAFLSGLCYTENCFDCQFAKLERAGDITLGDSWGSTLCEEEQNRGISLILCQTEKGQNLINSSQIHLESVDLNKAIAANHQLVHPTERPKRYDIFWKGIKRGRTLEFMMLRCYPKATISNIINTIRRN